SKSKNGARGADAGKNDTGSGDSSIDEFRNYDSEMEFLLLDDVLPIDCSDGRRKINLRQEEENDDWNGMEATGGYALDVTMAMASKTDATGVLDTTLTTTGRLSNNPVSTPEVTLLSLGGVLSASVMDQSGTFVINRESMGKSPPSALSRMLMTTLQAAGGRGGADGNIAGEGNLRLLAGACDVDANGALLLPGTSVSVFLRGGLGAGEVVHAGEGNAISALGNTGEAEVQIFPQGLSPSRSEGGTSFSVGNSCTDGGAVDFGGNEVDNNDDDGADGAGFELYDDNEVNATSANQDEGKHETAQAELKEDRSAPRKKEENDPWALLDPHQPSKEKPQPLRIGVTFRLPRGLSEDDRPSALVNGSRTRAKGTKKKRHKSINPHDRQTFHEKFAPPFLADMTFENAISEDIEGNDDENDKTAGSIITNRYDHLKFLQSKDLIFGEEFAYIAKAHAKQRMVMKRRRQFDKHHGTSDANDLAGANTIQNVAEPFNYDDENDDYGGGFDFGGSDDDTYGADEQNHGTQSLHPSNVDFNAIDEVFATARFDDIEQADDDNFGTSQQTFEELCQAHLRKFSKSAEIYAAETQLTKRVGIWQAGLIPVLNEQEKRAEFDIHSCGRQILQTLEDKLSTRKRTSIGQKKLEKSLPKETQNLVDFATISKGSEDYEVCRKFLATLMLCNCGNIALRNGENDGEGLLTADSLQMELLDSNFEAMEAFLAPSAAAVSKTTVIKSYEKENFQPSSSAD
ncbi:hypothetical protein ACHAXS_010068, partial [Conticribra weissflogii]